ncbi:MAG: type II toxin-antitoxin system HicA family toxin [Candidatus Sericytochromatia bacterium]|nr:type II toxin-antitoxin system HicA family toxin [Candidatus Sericytochromatia bacterium]
MGLVFSSRQLIDMVQADGWLLVRVKGDHHHFRHPSKPGTVTIPHPNREVAKGTANSILRQAGMK